MFLVTHHNYDITTKNKEGSFGLFQVGILLHSNFAIQPFTRFMTEKGQIVS